LKVARARICEGAVAPSPLDFVLDIRNVQLYVAYGTIQILV